jgi:choline dehydrogenase-like flavoprotein
MGQVGDLVIVGFGGAGAAAAITGGRRGASVLVLEKQAADRHTPSTRMSGGLVMGAHDAGEAARYLDACAGGMIPADVSRAWAERAVIYDWLNGLDAKLNLSRIGGAEHPRVAGASAIDVYQPGGAKHRLDARRRRRPIAVPHARRCRTGRPARRFSGQRQATVCCAMQRVRPYRRGGTWPKRPPAHGRGLTSA